jgi:hypothetical protein
MLIAKSMLLKRSYLCVAEILLLFTVGRIDVHTAVCYEVMVLRDVWGVVHTAVCNEVTVLRDVALFMFVCLDYIVLDKCTVMQPCVLSHC